MGGLIGIAWVIVLVLKIAGLAFVTTSWFWIILWPLIPVAILFVLSLIFGAAWLGLNWNRV